MKNKKSISIFIFLLIAAVLTGCASVKNYTPDEYLKQNHEELNFNNRYEDYFNILDDDVNKYDIFLTGESHATKANFDLELGFIEYFNKKAGVRDVLSESSYSEAEYINQYLETGNEAKLNIVFDNLKGTLAWSKEYVEFCKKLRQYDMSLPEDKRVKLVGIDIEHQLDVAVYYMKIL